MNLYNRIKTALNDNPDISVQINKGRLRHPIFGPGTDTYEIEATFYVSSNSPITSLLGLKRLVAGLLPDETPSKDYKVDMLRTYAMGHIEYSEEVGMSETRKQVTITDPETAQMMGKNEHNVDVIVPLIMRIEVVGEYHFAQEKAA